MNKKGYSLVEIMIVVAIIGLIASIAPVFFSKVYEFLTVSETQMTIQRDSRTALDIINRNLRQATISSIIVDRKSSDQPPYSRISFSKVNDVVEISYYQEGSKLMMKTDSRIKTLTENLGYLSFSFPRTDDLSIISVSMTVQKITSRGRKKAIHVAIEKIRIMND